MTANIRYQEALDYLYSFIDYSRERSDRYSAQAFDPARMEALLEGLGSPHKGYPALHIAGTKGKGSVAAFSAGGLAAAGYRTGLYTSPHLVRFTERIQINGDEIGEDQVVQLVEMIKPQADRIEGITTFELITALAFVQFAQAEVDCAVFEVGLGGRLDATNVITPLVTAITSISLDHTHILGDSLEAIAAEKAGIIKRGVPVVVAPQADGVLQVIEKIAADRGAPLVRLDGTWSFARESSDLDGQTMLIWSRGEAGVKAGSIPPGGAHRLRIPLLGEHQIVNAALAYALLRQADARGLRIAESSIAEGFARTRWPGRFQVLSRSPAVIVDAAHNRESARRLGQALDDYFPDRRVLLVFGASEDKDIQGMIDELAPKVHQVIVTQAFHPRAAGADDLHARFASKGLEANSRLPVQEALREALRRADEGEVVLIAGSLFVVGEVLDAWQTVKAVLKAEV